MKDIADRVGVSIESVSRLLNREAGVSPATAQQILDVASNLGFRRKDLARDLRRAAGPAPSGSHSGDPRPASRRHALSSLASQLSPPP
jgi:transcriptional regulator with XRE-family HTH domain